MEVLRRLGNATTVLVQPHHLVLRHDLPSPHPCFSSRLLTLPGDEIVCVINRARPITQTSNPGGASNVQKVRRGDVRRAVIVRTKQPIMRADGRVVR